MAAALLYGADAVYLGGKSFGLRAGVPNFDADGLREAAELVHDKGKKLYVTMNALPRNSDLAGLTEHIDLLSCVGADAVIVADIGLLMAVKRRAPGLSVHISTQAGVVNYLTASELYNLGASRVILARELTIDEIAGIRAHTPPALELEAFVHGAMCMSFSGRCVISDYMTGRDANRGECAQPCRWNYALVEEKRPGEYYPLYEDEGTYILNAKDLSMIEHLDKLAKAGICSFKIEGRAKSAYYTAVVTNAYRAAIDAYLSAPDDYNPPLWVKNEVYKVSHREYSTGFYFGVPEKGQCTQSGGYIREWEVIAVVTGYEDVFVTLSQRNRFFDGDEAELLVPGEAPRTIKIDGLRDADGNPLEAARHAMLPCRFPYPDILPVGSIIRQELRRDVT